jgi:hypothetical protein
MPLALVVIAVFVILTGLKGNFSAVGTQFTADIMGPQGFLSFLVGIIGIAVFFRLIDMPNAGRAFVTLVIVVFLLQNSSVITTLQNLGTTASTTSTGEAVATGTAATGAPGPVTAPAQQTPAGSAAAAAAGAGIGSA